MGPENRLSSLPEHGSEALPKHNTDNSMLSFAATGRTKPLLFSEAYEDLVLLKQRQSSKLFKDVEVTNSKVSISEPAKQSVFSRTY